MVSACPRPNHPRSGGMRRSRDGSGGCRRGNGSRFRKERFVSSTGWVGGEFASPVHHEPRLAGREADLKEKRPSETRRTLDHFQQYGFGGLRITSCTPPRRLLSFGFPE